MVHPKVLAKYGCTSERLRQIFTAPSAGDGVQFEDAPGIAKGVTRKRTDGEIRGRFEAKIRSRILDGIQNNMSTYRPYQAVDICWDAPPIQKETIPLMLYAMGKVDVSGLMGCLQRSCGDATAAKFFTKDPVKNTVQVNTPRLSEITVDLMRSYITRRLSAMDGLWSNLWPLWKYDPRGADPAAVLRADVLTQRVDIISDSYNYRHFGSQCRRDMLLYGRSVAFARTSWDRAISWKFKTTNTGEPGDEVDSAVDREGVHFVNPHPTRIFADLSAPLANLNTDTGPRWVGYWDVTRYGNLKQDEHAYYNLDHIYTSSAWFALANQFSDFFSYYFDPCVLTWPDPAMFAGPALSNDRSAHVGLYTSQWNDRGVLVTQYYEKINPKREGIGDYDADVWVRFVVAGDYTVIGAEFMPSIPAAVGSINWNDNRLGNQSMGMALLGYQDQASNIISSMIQKVRQCLMTMVLIDKDSIEEPMRSQLIEYAKNKENWIDPVILPYSATKLREMGIQNPGDAFKFVQPAMSDAFQAGLAALGQLLNLADRLLVLSPNELGQPNPREVSSREVQEISTSTQSMYSFINQGPREQTAAMKKLVFESLMCCGTENFRVPVEGRYTMEVVKAAGFEVGGGASDKIDFQWIPSKTPVLGNLKNLDYEYLFDTRDGSERVLNTQGAQVIQQLMQMLGQSGLMKALGPEPIVDLMNLVIRMSGAPTNFQIELPQGADQSGFGEPEQTPSAPQAQPSQQAGSDLGARVARNEKMLQDLLQMIQSGGGGAPAGMPPSPPAQPMQPAA